MIGLGWNKIWEKFIWKSPIPFCYVDLPHLFFQDWCAKELRINLWSCELCHKLNGCDMKQNTQTLFRSTFSALLGMIITFFSLPRKFYIILCLLSFVVLLFLVLLFFFTQGDFQVIYDTLFFFMNFYLYGEFYSQDFNVVVKSWLSWFLCIYLWSFWVVYIEYALIPYIFFY